MSRQLATTSQAASALELLLSAVDAEDSTVRVQVAIVLRDFDDPKARAALATLGQDSDYRVVGATLEGLL